MPRIQSFEWGFFFIGHSQEEEKELGKKNAEFLKSSGFVEERKKWKVENVNGIYI